MPDSRAFRQRFVVPVHSPSPPTRSNFKKLAITPFQLHMHGVIYRGIVANTSAPGSSLSVKMSISLGVILSPLPHLLVHREITAINLSQLALG